MRKRHKNLTYFAVVIIGKTEATAYALDVYPNERAGVLRDYRDQLFGEFPTAPEAFERATAIIHGWAQDRTGAVQ